MTFIDHPDIIAEGLHFLEDMGAQYNCSLFGDLADQVAHFDDLVGIEAIGRLIQYHEIWFVDDGLRNAHPLLVATGKIPDKPLAEMTDAHFAHHFFDGRLHGSGLHQPDIGAMPQVFFHGKIGLQRRLLWQETDMLLGFHGLIAKTYTLDIHFPLRLLDHTTDDVHDGGFSRAIGTEQSINAIAGKLEIDVFDCPLHTVPVAQVLHFHDGCTHLLTYFLDKRMVI